MPPNTNKNYPNIQNHMRNNRYIIGLISCFLLLMLALPKAGKAQSTSFIHFGVEKGIAQSQVGTIEQDQEGNLWVGTLAGLTKYNGHNFQNFTRQHGLAEEWITACHVGDSGDVWLGHWAGGLSCYIPQTDSFVDLEFEVFSNFKSVTAIDADDNGNIWIATNGAGVFCYRIDSGNFIPRGISEGIVSSHINALCVDHQNRVWFGTDNGITIYDPKKEAEGSTAYMRLEKSTGLPSNQVRSMKRMRNKDILVATSNGAVLIKNNNSGSISKEGFILFDQSKGLRSNNITAILEDGQNNLWFGTADAGVTRYNQSSGQYANYTVDNGLNYNRINALLEDREGQVWIGTDLGLNLFRGEVFQVFDESDSVANNIVWSILEDSRRNLWLGTNSGITRLSFPQFINPNDRSARPIVRNYTEEGASQSKDVQCIFEDSQGDLWFGAMRSSVARYIAKEDRFIYYDSIGGEEKTVFSISEDNEGNMWFGTRHGAIKMDRETEKLEPYTTVHGLGGNHIFRIFKDSRGAMWFAPLGGALTVFNGNGFDQYSEARGIEHQIIMTIAEDDDHNLWFGAYGGGVYRFADGQFTNYHEADGLSSNTPYAIIADDENNIWVGTNKGVDKFDPQTETFTHYGRDEGFPGVEVNANAICKDGQGNIWFGTIMGAVRYNPDEDLPNTKEPVMVVSAPRVFSAEMTFPENGKYNSDQNHLTFEFIGVSLSSPNRVRYQYMLEGVDKDWSETTTQTEAVYASLSPGKYTFKVRSANENGVWNQEPSTINFRIMPPFWRTWWFYVLVFLVGLAIVYAIDKYRVKNLHDARVMLEKKVSQRTEEVDRKNQELAAKNRSIMDNLLYAERIQKAILPTKQTVQGLLRDSFVVFRPKDVVSGDFYWIDRVDDRILLAVVDCSGHSVPGAFMSILGYNRLNRAAKEFGLRRPADILNKLQELLAETLNKGEGEDGVKDEMDIALCSIDLKTQKLEFAGANCSLYIARSVMAGEVNISIVDASEQQVTIPDNSYKLIEIKADKHSIGAATGKPFKNHEIDLLSSDSIYLFTDGFAHQFGGDHGKKFKYNRLKQLLLFNQDKSMPELGGILEQTFEEWRGELEQMDDICMIGFKPSDS